MKVLVTGAAGYIGSHAVRRLLASGHEVVALDNFSRGHREALPAGIDLIETDLREAGPLAKWLAERRLDCVMHFAAFAYVGESVEDPLLYYRNNAAGTLNLLRAVDEAKIQRMVFSSTCATYGEPQEMPIREETPQNPINPYGASKLFSERMLKDYAAAKKDFACVALRYFNVAGSAEDGSLGEHHDPSRTSSPSSCRRRSACARRWWCSAPTTRRPTALACATTSTSRISSARTSS